VQGSKRLLSTVAILALLAGGANAVVRARVRQARRERALVEAWVALGVGLRGSASRLGVDLGNAPDSWELSKAPSEPSVQARVDSLESRVWAELSRRGRGSNLDSLREALRRDRENEALALAHCREGTGSRIYGWILWGYPPR
jgi:hypothetical protein